MPATTTSLIDRLARAIGDPGAHTPRADNHFEPLTHWMARAVAAMLVKEYAPTAPLLHTQDNLCTAEIMFCVQEKKIQYGLNSDYSDGDNYRWLCVSDGEHTRADEHVTNILDAREREGLDATHDGCDYEKFYYFSYWHTHMVAFTLEGAQEYLRRNGHNHSGEKRIYGESFHRCPEMLSIRALLLGLTDKHTLEPAKEASA